MDQEIVDYLKRDAKRIIINEAQFAASPQLRDSGKNSVRIS
jgi:hypothetical protein